MEQLVIREVRQQDAKDLQSNIFPRNTPEEVEKRVADSIKKMQSGDRVHLVAEFYGAVVGNMSLIREIPSLYQHRCLLSDVVVNPAYQRKGIAKGLFIQCKMIAAEKGFKLITVSCRGGTAAEEVYRRLGFIEIGRMPNGLVEPWGDLKAFDEVLFYQEL